MDFNLISLPDMLNKSTQIGEGSSRIVYRYENYIFKRAKNNRGNIECDNEQYLYQNIADEYRKYLCPVLHYDGDIIVMYCAEPISLDEVNENVLPNHNEIISYLCEEFDMDDFDLKCHFNWGKINNNYVLIDYGHHYFDENLNDLF